jgi:hypothetical protein
VVLGKSKPLPIVRQLCSHELTRSTFEIRENHPLHLFIVNIGIAANFWDKSVVVRVRNSSKNPIGLLVAVNKNREISPRLTAFSGYSQGGL